MELYGLKGFTHGWGRILTVMSPAGASAVLAHIEPGDDVQQQGGAGQLPQYFERRAGGLRGLIEAYDIELLDKAAWDAKKAALGDIVYD